MGLQDKEVDGSMETIVNELGTVFISICAGVCIMTWMISLLAYVSLLL